MHRVASISMVLNTLFLSVAETSRRLTHEIRPLQSSGIQVSTYSEAQGLLQEVTSKSLNTRGHHTQDGEDEEDVDIVGVSSMSFMLPQIYHRLACTGQYIVVLY